ncbi:phage major capsid protein [bacterium]|nr:phage major capsid protein [bacterium]
MPIQTDLLVKKHAQDVLKTLKVRTLQDFQAHAHTWAELNKAERTLKRAINDTIDNCIDGSDEKRAAELENVADALANLKDEICSEKDFRSSKGNQAPRANAAVTEIPAVEPREAPAVDGGLMPFSNEEPYSLRSGDKMTTWAQARGAEDYADLSLGRYLRSMAIGAKTDTERRALSEGTDSAGGFTVPTILSSQLIDALRAASVVQRAGAQTVPLTSDNQSIAKVASDPAPAFRNEAAAVAESDPTFSSVTFTPRSLMVMVKVSRELLDDSLNIGSALPNMITAAMAAEMDRVALEGTGVAPQPTGLRLQSGIGNTALNAALTSYAPLLGAQTGILNANGGPVNAIIAHPRDAGTLAGLTDTTGQPLNVPPAISGVPMLTTSSIQVDAGSGNDESNLYVGNFANLMIGMRNDIRVEVLRERFADTHQYAFVAHMRFDVAIAHAASFHKVSGITG